LKEIMSKDANPNLALRIQVESGGCHGFQYLISLTTLPPLPLTSPKSGSQSIELESAAAPNTSTTEPNAVSSTTPDKIPAALDEDDTVFAAKDGSGAMVVMDGPSLELLRGSKVDYTMELIGSQFKIVDNPFATSSCGCGTSFDIKV
jgi:Fe-S cluster assembly iron-binding protein IscA